MTTFTVTPEPAHVPPRVRIDMDTEVVGNVFSEITVKRNGVAIRSQPPVGSQVTVGYDYEAPFGQSQTWTVDATVADSGVTDWTESWASLASWTGDTASWSVAAGVASSAVFGAAITRTVSGTIGRVAVTNPILVRIELLNSSNAVVASVECGDNKITLFGAGGYSQVVGSGTFTLTLSSNFVTVAGTGWSVGRAYNGTPVKVRLVGMVGALQTASWSTVGTPHGVAVDGSGNVYIADNNYLLLRKFNSAGTQTASWSTVGQPFAVAVDGSGNVYIADATSRLLRKFNSAGTQTASWSTVGVPLGVVVDGSGNVYITEYTNNLLRKFNSAGTQTASWSTVGTPWGVTVDGSGNVYIADYSGKLLRKFNSAGTQTASWSTVGQPTGVAIDGSGNVYITDFTNNLLRKFNSAGTQTASWSTVGEPHAVAVDGSGNVYIADATNRLLRKFAQASGSVGQTIASLTPGTTNFSGTDTDTLAGTDAWLIHPSLPDLSVNIGDTGQLTGIYVVAESGSKVSRGQKAEVFSPIGRERDVVITNGSRRVGDTSLVLFAPTAADRTAINAIVTDQTPLLLRVPPSFGWDLVDDWYSVGSVDDDRTRDRTNANQHLFTLPLSPVDAPVVAVGAQWTWGDVLLTYATWADVLAGNDTWLDVLVGPQ